MSPRRLIVAAIAALAIAAFAAGTAATMPTAKSAAAKADATPAKTTLVVADTAVAETLDPDSVNSQFIPNQTAVAQVYTPLLAIALKKNPDNLGGGMIINPDRLVANLAASYTRSPDGRTLTFKLKHGIMSDYNHELVADDMKWVFDRATAHRRTAYNSLARTGQVVDYKAVDKYTFQVTTAGPNLITPLLMGTRVTLVPIDSVEAQKHATADDPWADKWLAENAAGFGPYRVSSWTKGQQITYERRDQFVGKKPYFKTVKVLAIPDLGSRFQAVEAGDADVAFAITPDAAGRVNAKRNRGKLKIDQFPGNGQVWAVPNFNVKEFANNSVRQALAYAVPYKDIIDKVYYGRATIAKTLFYSYMPCRQDKYWHFDTNVTKAKQLMEQAGYKNGIGPVDLLYPIERPLMGLVATVLQQAWGDIGIKINLVPTPETVAQSRLNTRHDIPIYLSDTLSVVNPAVPGFTQFFTTGAVTNLGNYPGQAAQDALHKTATSTLDMKVECQAADQFQQIFQRDLPFLPLVGFNDLYLMGSHVQGFSWYPDKSTRFATAFWK